MAISAFFSTVVKSMVRVSLIRDSLGRGFIGRYSQAPFWQIASSSSVERGHAKTEASETTVKDIRSILQLTHEQGLSVRAVWERLKISKTSVATYLLRAKETGLSVWPLPAGLHDDAALERHLFRRVGRPPQDLVEPNWRSVSAELKRKGVTLTLLWQEYRASRPDGYGYTWFCDRFATFERRAHATFRNRHEAGAVMQTDYAGHTIPITDPSTGVIHSAQIFVAMLSASSLTFAMPASARNYRTGSRARNGH
ncbi:Transposase [Agrobacterium rosae]|uniref:Transposase n=1 Tax=Agrobacterium rosae TaxID=1972867 RepID=A0A1R3U5W4_9HYPH|nr:Transposase [Agrobacterium rosae]